MKVCPTTCGHWAEGAAKGDVRSPYSKVYGVEIALKNNYILLYK